MNCDNFTNSKDPPEIVFGKWKVIGRCSLKNALVTEAFCKKCQGSGITIRQVIVEKNLDGFFKKRCKKR